MKLTALIAFSSASLALAAPGATVHKRADFCGQWDQTTSGTYTIYNNLWGRNDATSGSQCTGVDGISGNTLKWHTSWSWAGGPGHVKSYANAVSKLPKVVLSSIKSIPSTYLWAYTGKNIIANVSYDLFTSSSASGKNEYEIMIWLAALGGAGPISATGKSLGVVTLGGIPWNLYRGNNGVNEVFSFVAVQQQNNYKGDLNEFLKYLVAKQGLPGNQYLVSAGAGTEPFSGSGAKLTVSGYSLSMS